MKKILVLIRHLDIETYYIIHAFSNKRKLNKFVKDNKIDLKRDRRLSNYYTIEYHYLD